MGLDIPAPLFLFCDIYKEITMSKHSAKGAGVKTGLSESKTFKASEGTKVNKKNGHPTKRGGESVSANGRTFKIVG